MNYIFDIVITILLIICVALLFLVLKKKNNQETDRLFASVEKLGDGINALKEQSGQQNNAQAAPAKKAPQEPLELIYVGDINSNKNPGLTITAAQHLQALGKSVHLTAVGSIKEDKYRLLMEQTDFVTHYDRCPQEQVIQHLRKADIFVMPSHTETFGLVYAEAMSQGLPVLYTAGQGFDGHFPDGTVGYAVSDTDAEALAEKILLVAQRYEEISPACVPAAKRFNWDQIAAEYIEIYHQLAKETTQP